MEKNSTVDVQKHHLKLNHKTREERNPKEKGTIGGKDLLFSVFYSKDQKVSKNIVHKRKFHGSLTSAIAIHLPNEKFMAKECPFLGSSCFRHTADVSLKLYFYQNCQKYVRFQC